ncbi:Fe(3+) ABC transporter substrate-binding protein [Synechocystis salina]|uniref:Fe(3+) ABC transporter substrate-binding protein n=1 Tax=Synechocystis salina LEGE 00031 TaxID=1828736 RepID=A0ABR9VX54_9SYNC|nr:Fe(3+) ABC transporter substrate-binding protein [Synechocystis salina]MBE9242353.1 Fe(3+) ABC transporter substrate-binding protein [Synechocystis salina LEGE 00041]MBE9255453.1 Fe(3+) ABC transporter substrate-binding protein [Synechocystis salina LEGE 00031]
MVQKLSRRLFLSIGTAVSVVVGSQLLSSCGQSPNAPIADTPGEQQEINLYSSRHYNTDNELYAKFTEETGIKVNLIEGKADELLERIKSEGANSPADVLLTVDLARLWRAEEDGIFQPVESEILQTSIPEYLRSPDGMWFGFTKRARVIMYNKAKVKPEELSTYEDLADPKWKGRIIIRSSSNEYNQSLVASLIVADGEQSTLEWAKGFVSNFAREPQGNDTAQIEAVSSGEADLTLANTYYMGRLLESEEPAKKAIAENVGVFFPNQEGRGTHVNVSGVGVVKTAPNREGAVKFIEFLVSEPAQAFLAQNNYEYPVLAGVPLNKSVASFGEFKSDTTNLDKLGPALAPATKIMNEAGWK